MKLNDSNNNLLYKYAKIRRYVIHWLIIMCVLGREVNGKAVCLQYV